jgi:ADP-ribosylglycohydrolase
MKTILILEDNEARAELLREAVATLGDNYSIKTWSDAGSMCAECEEYFAETALISLDHDLNPKSGAADDPGTGLDVARFLGDFLPVCPVIVHSQNMENVWTMHNELRFAGWTVAQAGGMGTDWSQASWLKCAREILRLHPNSWQVVLPSDHRARVERMWLSLDGLAIGDALGEMLCHRSDQAEARISAGNLPPGPWFHTDDTEMAISICAVLKSYGRVNPDALSKRFVRRFERDPDRGYGMMTDAQMRQILAGGEWQRTAANAFRGQGSLGNGSAMRVAPLGAYFADDLERCAEEARASSLVTHTHPEGVAGAIAVAVAAAAACQLQAETSAERARHLFDLVIQHTPESQVRRGLKLASSTPPEVSMRDVARALGNGSLVTAPDTVPFCIWMAAHHLDDFVAALGKTISADGDCDTNAAIVGGIVALSAGRESIPVEWLQAREAICVL